MPLEIRQEICFLADDYLRGTLRDLANYDLIVAGYSHWHVAYNFWPLSKCLDSRGCGTSDVGRSMCSSPPLPNGWVRVEWRF